MMDSPGSFPDTPLEQDDTAYPCKGCGEILEEGKAFELAGNRWHIDCFRCNTCSTLLDSDANLLLLGDGSLICNNCTYSCNACGNKIEDLAILTGDQAFCANCFRCRNCKRKIENLRYARTSQGIFCMSCHESLMARRRKKSRAAAAQAKAASNAQSPMFLDKSLPSLPPSAIPPSALPSGRDTPGSDPYADTPTELSPMPRAPASRQGSKSSKRDRSPLSPDESKKENVSLSSSSYDDKRNSASSQAQERPISQVRHSDTFNIPLVLDTGSTPAAYDVALGQDPERERPGERGQPKVRDVHTGERDYFTGVRKPSSHHPSNDRPSTSQSKASLRDHDARPGSSKGGSPHVPHPGTRVELPTERAESHRPQTRSGQTLEVANGYDSRATTPGSSGDDVRLQQAMSRPRAQGERIQSAHGDQFQLQEVPKGRRSGARSPHPDGQSPVENRPSTQNGSLASSAPGEDGQQLVPRSNTELLQPVHMGQNLELPRSMTEPIAQSDRRRSRIPSEIISILSQVQSKPERKDSLRDNHSVRSIPRKQAPPRLVTDYTSASGHVQDQSHSASSGIATEDSQSAMSSTLNGTLDGSRSVESLSQPGTDISKVPTQLPERQASFNATHCAPFITPRATPHPPAPRPHSPQHSASAPVVPQNLNGHDQPSPGLPRNDTSANLNMEEDLARILGDSDESSILRRVSNVVKHGRSFSDLEMRGRGSAKWPRSPGMPSPRMQGLHSPNTTSPQVFEENAMLKLELRRSALKIAELEARINGNADMKALDGKLREKRSTVAFLDTQKELMVRELEVLTERVAEAKHSQQPFSLEGLKSKVVREFAASLERLKEVYAPEVEELIRRKNHLIEDTANLTRLRDQAIQETEQLNLKNAQLADLNNELTQQIQERYKAHREVGAVDSPRPLNGLGVSNPFFRDKLDLPVDIRDFKQGSSHGHSTPSSLRTLTDQNDAAQSATVLQQPHVVDIGKARKFNWKKGGQSVAKGVSRGLKGAFSSNSQSQYNHNHQKENQVPESVPYSMAPVMEAPSTDPNRSTTDLPRHGGGLFGQRLGRGGPVRMQSNGNLSVITAEGPSTLFGSDLIERGEYEKRPIPSVVTRCIEEVELRGMDVEGIYRKTGGNSQVKMIQEGFERSHDYDISDPCLDITAVTSVLKQYLRRLPIPLMTYDAYDGILEASAIVDEEKRALSMRATIEQLPPRHRDCLEFLIFHLARVAMRDKENYMTPRNLAVVFAPTIMRDVSIDREMTDTHAKNNAIQFLIENNKTIFSGF